MGKRSSGLNGCASRVSPVALVLIVFCAEPAFAAGARRSDDRRQSQEKAARKACLTGDYSTGISILADLFVEHQDPVFVFNQGRCLEQNSRYKDAVSRFEEFLRLAQRSKLDQSAQETAQKHLDDCKAKVAEEDQRQAMLSQPLVRPEPQPIQQPTPTPPPVPTIQTVEHPKPQPEPVSAGKGLLIGGIVTGTVGVGAVIAGYFSARKSNDMVNQMQSKPDEYTSDKHSTQQTYKTLSWVGYGVGAACIAGGIVMIAIGASRPASPNQTEVALVPAIGPGQAGILLRGGF